MFIEFDLRPFSAVLRDLFIFIDNFPVLVNKSALNRLILRHYYFWGYLCLLAGVMCACSCAYAYARIWVGLGCVGWCFWG